MVGTEHPEPRNIRLFAYLFSLAQIIGLLVVILLTLWLGHFHGGFSWESTPQLEFNWHPVMMSLGMVLLYADSILIYRLFRSERKCRIKLAHALLHTFVLVFTIVGLKAVFDSHNLHVDKDGKPDPIPNMYSLHSWVGLISVLVFSYQFLSGLITFLFPGMQHNLRAKYLSIHTSIGVIGFVLSLTSAMMGILEKAHWAVDGYVDLPPEGLLVNITGLLLVLFGVIVVILVLNPGFKRQNLPEDELLLADTLRE